MSPLLWSGADGRTRGAAAEAVDEDF